MGGKWGCEVMLRRGFLCSNCSSFLCVCQTIPSISLVFQSLSLTASRRMAVHCFCNFHWHILLNPTVKIQDRRRRATLSYGHSRQLLLQHRLRCCLQSFFGWEIPINDDKHSVATELKAYGYLDVYIFHSCDCCLPTNKSQQIRLLHCTRNEYAHPDFCLYEVSWHQATGTN